MPETSCPSIRGCRECRALDAPAAARVEVVNPRVSHHGHTGNTRHSPRNGFNKLLRALPGEPGCFATVIGVSVNLTPASGCQDHTTSPSADRALVSCAPASIASNPAFVTFAKRPSVGWTGVDIQLIWVFGKSEYFCKEGLTANSVICPSGQIAHRTAQNLPCLTYGAQSGTVTVIRGSPNDATSVVTEETKPGVVVLLRH